MNCLPAAVQRIEEIRSLSSLCCPTTVIQKTAEPPSQYAAGVGCPRNRQHSIDSIASHSIDGVVRRRHKTWNRAGQEAEGKGDNHFSATLCKLRQPQTCPFYKYQLALLLVQLIAAQACRHPRSILSYTVKTEVLA